MTEYSTTKQIFSIEIFRSIAKNLEGLVLNHATGSFFATGGLSNAPASWVLTYFRYVQKPSNHGKNLRQVKVLADLACGKLGLNVKAFRPSGE